MTSLIGLCVPKQCTLVELEFLKKYYYKLGSLFGFKSDTLKINLKIQKQMYEFDSAENVSMWVYVFIIVLVVLALGCCLGTIIEQTQIGNRRDIIVILDQSNVNYDSYKDVNRKLLLEKEKWTFYFLIFSFIRNNLHILCKRRKKIKIQGLPAVTRKTQQLLENLQVFDGIRAIYSLQFCYAISFFCAFYQILQFPHDKMNVMN